jgi:acetyl esterase/lipase
MSRIAIPAMESATGATAAIYAQVKKIGMRRRCTRAGSGTCRPALILAVESAPLRDEAEQYSKRLINSGVWTTVRRLPPA